MTTTTAGTLSAALIAEIEREAATTRRVLERVPQDKLSWRPHPKSMSLGALALHVATIPGAIAELLSVPVREAPDFTAPEAVSHAQIVSALDAGIAKATGRLAGWNDSYLGDTWRMEKHGHVLLSLPRVDVVRSIMLNHWYHHRGQLSLYLRLLEVAVPSIYGPSADEKPFS